MNKKEILTFLQANKQLLKERFNIHSIALAGSFARNEATAKSDIDIIVDMPSSFTNFFNLKYYLEEHLGRVVDLGLEKNLRAFIKKQMQDEMIYV
jgi:predicted nucleotidyltransferase